MKRERRSQPTEIAISGRTISGYAAKFNTLSNFLSADDDEREGFFEIIRPGAFNLAASSDVILNYDHEDRDILGRTKSGTLKLRQDDVGLFFECELPERCPTIDVPGLIESIGRGDIRGCSFAFNVIEPNGEQWGCTEEGKKLRALTNIEIYDVCPTPCPAYDDTEVAVRSFKRHVETVTRELRSARPVLNLSVARLRIAQALCV